ncbi:aminotransferase class I/II-fold pyridoxal phosphate-dependent enzyme, partial [candidate division KSB1 bacterium]
HAFCEEASKQCLVLVDEAYNELVEDPKYRSMMDLVRKGDNVMVLRTFSKIHGLAGMRMGYGIAKPDIISEFRRVQTNFAPNSQATLAAAIASYQDTEFLEFSKKKNLEAKEFFYTTLEGHGYSYIPSHTNFVIFEIDEEARTFVNTFREHNIYLRPFEFSGKHWCRCSMGTAEEMQALSDSMNLLA